jgi:hypothetical protein
MAASSLGMISMICLLKQAQSTTCAYSLKKFHGGGNNVCLLCFKDKIVMLTILTK